jgi:hypothetical protein
VSERNRSANRPERWIREDESPRLQEAAPGLTALKLELFETAGERKVLDSTRIQHVIVHRAAAHFEIACSDQGCQDGGFDITPGVLRALRLQSPQFEGEATCLGSVGQRACDRMLKYRGIAEWRESPGETPAHLHDRR